MGKPDEMPELVKQAISKLTKEEYEALAQYESNLGQKLGRRTQTVIIQAAILAKAGKEYLAKNFTKSEELSDLFNSLFPNV